MSIPTTQTRVVLNERPKASIIPGKTFRTERGVPVNLNELGDENVLVEVWDLSLDPAMRGWLDDRRSYIPPVQLNAVMRAAGVGKIVAGKPGIDSRGERIQVGDWVTGVLGWQEYANVLRKGLTKASLPSGAHITDLLSVLGNPGQTAYWGLKDVGELKQGETVLVTGAAGAVGMVACQIAKHVYNCKVIGIAGSSSKCEWLVKELGIDSALNYKEEGFVKKFRNQVGFVDVMFDNVGGEILNLTLARLNPHARIILCGAISDYNAGGKQKGLTNYMALIGQKASIRGFIVFDYQKRYAEAEKDLARWLGEGKIKRKEHRVKGVENAPQGLLDLFAGANTGKFLLTVKDQNSSGSAATAKL